MSENTFPKKILKKAVRITKGRPKKAVQPVAKTVDLPVQDADNLDIVAISMALYLHFNDQHEIEQTGFWLNHPLNYQTTWTSKDKLFKKLPIRKF